MAVCRLGRTSRRQPGRFAAAHSEGPDRPARRRETGSPPGRAVADDPGVQPGLRILGVLPGVIHNDIRLPDESGLVLARELKADRHWKSVPIIAVTALAMNNDEGRILDAGCDAYIAKPISVSELTETVQKYVSSSTLA